MPKGTYENKGGVLESELGVMLAMELEETARWISYGDESEVLHGHAEDGAIGPVCRGHICVKVYLFVLLLSSSRYYLSMFPAVVCRAKHS